ncbi:hypothetical protein RRG08_015296 [Elysia crispata]|uniref:Uncharacterized protein n=1 Tax=Elysia crispata TaxID=231223 RepID=A0AAE0ZTQ2_9GAST|nr:hypothetical protein RRG08_015296 [Elysia crispata]
MVSPSDEASGPTYSVGDCFGGEKGGLGGNQESLADRCQVWLASCKKFCFVLPQGQGEGQGQTQDSRRFGCKSFRHGWGGQGDTSKGKAAEVKVTVR